MNRKTVRLHACCCIGPHLIAALLSLYCDLRSWYDTIAALAVLLPVFVQFLTNDFSFRGIFHFVSILFGIIRYGRNSVTNLKISTINKLFNSQEVSRQPRSIDWNQLAQPDNLGFCLCVVHITKGDSHFQSRSLVQLKTCPLIRYCYFHQVNTNRDRHQSTKKSHCHMDRLPGMDYFHIIQLLLPTGA